MAKLTSVLDLVWHGPAGVAGLQWGQTRRRGGVSQGPYAGFNLAHHVGESSDVTAENWRVLAKAGGPTRQRLATCQQVHGDQLYEVSSGGHLDLAADALLSFDPAVGIGVYTADCVPVLYAVEARGGLAAAHCGWRGAAAGLAGKTLCRLSERGDVAPEDIRVWLGPSIAQASYEVGPELCDRFASQHLRKRASGTYELDVAGVVVEDLLANGAELGNITCSTIDTYTNEECYSYRRDGAVTGRMLSFVRWVA